jgi:hypothetical protein
MGVRCAEVLGMTDLTVLVEQLKRELAVPGTYDDVYPDTSDDDLVGSLKDGFAEAQLAGFFQDVTLAGTQTSKDLSAAGGALVVLYAGMRTIRAQMRVTAGTSRYKAANVEYETTASATLLRDELAFMRTRIDQLVSYAKKSGRQTYVLDGYVGRQLATARLGGFYGWEFGSSEYGWWGRP